MHVCSFNVDTLLQEEPTPPFKAEQRPDEQAMVVLACTVLVEDLVDIGWMQVLIETRLGITQEAVDIVDAFPAKP